MDEYIGIIKLFAGNFAPKGWMFCNGALLPINEYTALYSILGTTYGGDGRSTFGLPNLKARVPMGVGISYILGQMGGAENVTLGITNLPAHSHTASLKVSDMNSTDSKPGANASIAAPGYVEGRDFTGTLGFAQATPNVALNGGSVEVGATGQNAPIPTVPPFTVLNYIICVEGVYPPRP